METKYLEIIPKAGLTSQERADEINAELYDISRPDSISAGDTTNAMFSVVHKEGLNSIMVADNSFIPVHPDKDLAPLVSLFPDLTQGEINGLVAYINSQNGIHFYDILPSNTKEITKQYFEDNYLQQENDNT